MQRQWNRTGGCDSVDFRQAAVYISIMKKLIRAIFDYFQPPLNSKARPETRSRIAY